MLDKSHSILHLKIIFNENIHLMFISQNQMFHNIRIENDNIHQDKTERFFREKPAAFDREKDYSFLF